MVSADPVVNQERFKIQTLCKVCKTAGHSMICCISVKATVPTEDDYTPAGHKRTRGV